MANGVSTSRTWVPPSFLTGESFLGTGTPLRREFGAAGLESWRDCVLERLWVFEGACRKRRTLATQRFALERQHFNVANGIVAPVNRFAAVGAFA